MNIETNAKSEIEHLRNKLNEIGFSCYNIEKKTYNYEFVVENPPNKLKIQTYFGKKGVKTILQGNKETALYENVNSIIFSENLFNNEVANLDEPEDSIGSDESGKGDFFGPLVIAAAYVPKKSKDRLKKLGITDSKKLSDTQISIFAGKIESDKNILTSVLILEPHQYNKVYNQIKNLNKVLDKAHSKVIFTLLEKVNPESIIIDKFSNQELEIENKISSKINLLKTTQAERYISVATASILARDAFNQWFKQKENEGMPLQKGASKEVENKALDILNTFGIEILQSLCKIHFKTYKKIIDN